MSSEDLQLFTTQFKVETKDFFLDLKKNKEGIFLKISERNRSSKQAVVIPAFGIRRLQAELHFVIEALDAQEKNK